MPLSVPHHAFDAGKLALRAHPARASDICALRRNVIFDNLYD
jgi:hypothetical protein